MRSLNARARTGSRSPSRAAHFQMAGFQPARWIDPSFPIRPTDAREAERGIFPRTEREFQSSRSATRPHRPQKKPSTRGPRPTGTCRRLTQRSGGGRGAGQHCSAAVPDGRNAGDRDGAILLGKLDVVLLLLFDLIGNGRSSVHNLLPRKPFMRVTIDDVGEPAKTAFLVLGAHVPAGRLHHGLD
jgi:hypothetical protein